MSETEVRKRRTESTAPLLSCSLTASNVSRLLQSDWSAGHVQQSNQQREGRVGACHGTNPEQAHTHTHLQTYFKATDTLRRRVKAKAIQMGQWSGGHIVSLPVMSPVHTHLLFALFLPCLFLLFPL